MLYDRDLLLGGAKRNAVLELWEVQRYGSDSYGDADYVSKRSSESNRASDERPPNLGVSMNC